MSQHLVSDQKLQCINIEILRCKHKHCHNPHAWIQRGTGGPTSALLEKHTAIGFHSNADLDPLVNHQATKAAFNVGPSSAAFKWY